VGDEWLHHGLVVIESRAGDAARVPSWAQFYGWWAEIQREAARVDDCDLGILVLRLWGSERAEDWAAWLSPSDLTALLGAGPTTLTTTEPVCLRLGALLNLLPTSQHPPPLTVVDKTLRRGRRTVAEDLTYARNTRPTGRRPHRSASGRVLSAGPGVGHKRATHDPYVEARALCARCPALVDCLTYVTPWGGTSRTATSTAGSQT
jgi:hypothetical protein